MFVYGIAYAVVSLSCTLVLFVPTMFATGERDGVVAGSSTAPPSRSAWACSSPR